MKLCWLLPLVKGDVYLSNPRSSNNRLNEKGRNRNNANRLFDSQNNGRGGANVATEKTAYYPGQVIRIEYTQQHSCGSGNAKVIFVTFKKPVNFCLF